MLPELKASIQKGIEFANQAWALIAARLPVMDVFNEDHAEMH
jgi:hypothetical protein